MKTTQTLILSLATLVFALSSCSTARLAATTVPASRWSEQKANDWYAAQSWLVGADYINASAINQIEMWSADTYNPTEIDRELGWAESLGFNTLRVYLSSVVYDNDPKGLIGRIDNFLGICQRHGIRPLFVFFDDCWNEEGTYGRQPTPKPGVHNSGWVQDPSVSLRKDTVSLYPKMERYVKDVLGTFREDSRILLWDLWNEPGNSKHTVATLPLMKRVFGWARQVNPSQPITAGLWSWQKDFDALNAFQAQNSDVISYHNYETAEVHRQIIKYLSIFNRPLVCTEYMARTNNCLFKDVLPVLKAKKVVAINWGLVSGKTNTIFAWDKPMPDKKEPSVWFHDIFRQDGSPFSQDEVDLIRSLTGKK